MFIRIDKTTQGMVQERLEIINWMKDEKSMFSSIPKEHY